MSIRFILGRSGSGKTTLMMNEIIEKMNEEPLGNPIIYIVPEQMTFISEYKFVTHPDIRGMVRTQVYSFTRLAWRILQETGGMNRIHIHSTGISMLIRKIILEHKEELKIFQKNADKFGFIRQLEKILIEFKRYCISSTELLEQQATKEISQNLLDKLHDLHIIYERFTEAIRKKYLVTEDYLTLLAEKIPYSNLLRDAEIYLDGFYSFTPQEFLVIEKLMKHCKKVTIALPLDKPYRETVPDELNLFRMTGETYSTLYDMAKLSNIEVENDLVLNQPKRFHTPALAFLEKNFAELPPVSFAHEPEITIFEAANIRAEVEGIGRKIISFVRDHHYRFKDIAILIRNGQNYYELLETIFTDYQIPFYIDQKKLMLNHPLIELIRSTLEIITKNWRYESVFRAVKTDLLFPRTGNLKELRENMDLLENYCLAYGIQGDKWTSKNRFVYYRYRGIDVDQYVQTDEEKEFEEKLNEWRSLITTPIIRLTNRMKKAQNGKELCEALYVYLEELEIPVKLEQLKWEAEKKGELRLSREHEQVWNAVIDLFDQFVEILGHEKMSIKQFSEVIESGLETLHFSIVPPALDQVIVADLELSRLLDIKIAFIIGLNDGVLPIKFSDEGIFSDEDREQLFSQGIKIAPTSKERLLDEEFIAYKAFTTPAEYLFISYPLANEEGKALFPSPYIKRMKEMFPQMKMISLKVEPNEYTDLEQLEFIVNHDVALTYLTNELQRYKRKEPIEPLWWDCHNVLIESSCKQQVQKVLSSLFYENKAVNLSDDVIKDLYGETILGSISRMELFNSCPFSHFLKHGLKLQEREIFRLQAPDIGVLFHSALKQIGDMIQQMKRSWASLTEEEIEKMVNEVVQSLAPKLQNEILLSSNRYQYLKRKFEKIIKRAVKVLSEHAKASGFQPVGMEVSFGPKGELPPVRFMLKNGIKMELTGRIDRIDLAETDRGLFLRVIDYKSSKREVNIAEIYYGIALQMLTYLDILLLYSEKIIGKPAHPAGVLYFHVHNPLIKSNKPLSDKEIEDEIFKQFKMNGLVLSDPEIVHLMDKTLESGESKIISAGIKRDGQLTARSKIATNEEFRYLRKYVQNVFKKTGEKIVDGNVDIAPYKFKDEIPCKFCSFKSICQFDQRLAENNYRIFVPLDKNEALDLIKSEVEE